MKIKKEDFSFATHRKGDIYNGRKVRNNSNYIVFHKGNFVGELKNKSNAIAFIDNLVKYQKLEYTQE